MLTDAQRVALGRLTLTLQIIVVALAMGLTMFLFAVLFITNVGQAGRGGVGTPLVTYIAITAAIAATVLAWVLPGVIADKQRQAVAGGKTTLTSPLSQTLPQTEEFRDLAPLVSAYFTRLIVCCALLEGAGFFNLIAYLLEQRTVSLAVAGLLLLMIVSRIPSKSRLENWLEMEMRTIDQLRQMGPRNA